VASSKPQLLRVVLVVCCVVLPDVCVQDPAFDKIIKALYGDVDQFDAEVRSHLLAVSRRRCKRG
jgi:hypothetical protein